MTETRHQQLVRAAKLGGRARAEALSPERRKEIAQIARAAAKNSGRKAKVAA